VNGIERAAKQANIHAELVSSFAGQIGKFDPARLLLAWQSGVGHWPIGHRRLVQAATPDLPV